MKARIVRMEDAFGIMLPEALIDAAGLTDEVEIHAQPGRIVISAGYDPRAGWAEAARANVGSDGGMLDTDGVIPNSRRSDESLQGRD